MTKFRCGAKQNQINSNWSAIERVWLNVQRKKQGRTHTQFSPVADGVLPRPSAPKLAGYNGERLRRHTKGASCQDKA